jgi:DNA-binding CsgD family transcriptional regulator
LVQNVEMQVHTKSGDEIWLNTSVFTLERKKRRFTIHLLRDMTRAEHTKEALESFLDTLHFYGVADGNQDGAGNRGLNQQPPPSDSPSVAQLTRREIEVLELLAEGLSTKDLAKQLGVSPFTIRSHIESILLKTGVHTQAQAVAYAYRAKLL